MMKTADTKVIAQPGRKIMFRLYTLTWIVLAFTGFGQMPIFKRYYISDIPGMAWSADFFATHYIHYLGAVLLLGLIAFAAVDYLALDRKRYRLSGAGFVRIALLAGIVVTGVFRVLKNLPDIVFSPGATMFIDIAHLGFMMLYLLAVLFFAFTRSGWLVPRSS
ncbi:OhcB2 (Protein with transmembrane helices) [uncultured Desulfatiglans sp.]|nr:OhcB2 (Protein with transmembrane helices) [uncultured Desulfatiglans sp.]